MIEARSFQNLASHVLGVKRRLSTPRRYLNRLDIGNRQGDCLRYPDMSGPTTGIAICGLDSELNFAPLRVPQFVVQSIFQG